MEPERCPSFATAIKAGTPVFTPTLPSIADGLTVPTVGCNAVATAGKYLVMANPGSGSPGPRFGGGGGEGGLYFPIQ